MVCEAKPGEITTARGDLRTLVLLVEDDEDHAAIIAESLVDGFDEVEIAFSLREAREFLSRRTPDLAIVDWRLNDGEGMELLPDAIDQARFPIILMTSYGKEELAVEAMKRGAIDYVVKSSKTMRSMGLVVKKGLECWREREEQKQAEENLQRSTRLAELGLIAGELAHRFNNTFASIKGYVKLIRMDIEEGCVGQETLENTDAVLETVQSAAALVESLLSYTRQGRAKPVYFDIRAKIEQTLKLLRAIFPANVRIELNLGQPRYACLADPGDFETLITSLCINAKDAIGDKDGVLTVSLETTNSDSNDDINQPEALLTEKSYFKICVTDTGPGMDAKTRQMIFKDFFTTKKTGTGLGLATARKLLEGIGGQIAVDSELGQGATFTLLIPCSDQLLPIRRITPDKKHPPRSKNGEWVMVIDDEFGVARSLNKFLTRIGYRVCDFQSPIEGLNYFKQHAGEVAIVLVDYAMPEMTGDRVFSEMKSVRQDLPGILITGNKQKFNSDDAEKLGFNDYLTKPLDEGYLATRIDAILHQ